MSSWLITGGCGFIGRRLIEGLIREGGHVIRVVDDLSVGTRDDLEVLAPVVDVTRPDLPPRPSVIELVRADIRDASAVDSAAIGIEMVVHLAANTGVGPSVENPRADCTTNVLGTLNVLEAARSKAIKRLVFASSGATIGDCVPPIHEGLPSRPTSPYGASKLAGEAYCSAYHRSFGIHTTSLRFGNVYGPGSKHKSSVVAKFIRKIIAGENLEIYGDGSQTRDFVYIDDLIAAIRRSVEADAAAGEVFQIATSRETSVNELIEHLINAFSALRIAIPPINFAPKRVGDVARNYSNTDKARDLLGWSARTSLAEGLARTISWYLRHNNSANAAR